MIADPTQQAEQPYPFEDWVLDRLIPAAQAVGAQRYETLMHRWSGAIQEVVRRRQEAINYRTAEGIEAIWAECEDMYECVDDMNRGEAARKMASKTELLQGPLSTAAVGHEQRRSTAFIRMAARYTDAAWAKVAEFLVPADDKLFRFQPTPLPENAQGQPLDPDQAKQQMTMAETYVQDWLIEGRFTDELRKVAFDAARLGCGVMKGPMPRHRKQRRGKKLPNGHWRVDIQERVKPGSSWVDPWNLFPDPACGENIHHGDFIFERGFLSRRQVQDLKNDPRYDAAAIDLVLAQAPKGTNVPSSSGSDPRTVGQQQTQYEIWYYFGMMPKDILGIRFPEQVEKWQARQGLLADPESEVAKHNQTCPQQDLPVMIALINDYAISATLNQMDSGEFPYDVVPWTRRPGSWAGIGICEQVKTPQRLLNAATRSMIDNLAVSGAQIVFDEDGIYPKDEDWTIYPNKVWGKTATSGIEDVQKAFQTYEIPNNTQWHLGAIERAERWFEESTNIPLIAQGQSGKTQPKTFGGMALQNTNANQMLRQVVENFDQYLIEQHLTRYYEWFLADPEAPEQAKGDYQVKTNGAVALIERDQQDLLVFQLGEFAANPVYGIDPRKWTAMLLGTRRLDPAKLMMAEEEYTQKMESIPPPPQVQVAKMRQETEDKRIAAKMQEAMAELDLQQQNVGVQAAWVAQAAAAIEQKSELDRLKITTEFQAKLLAAVLNQQISLEQAKAHLAETGMKLDTQLQLGEMQARAEAQKPPTEPPGKASPGRSYQS